MREFKPLHLFASRNTYYVLLPSKIVKGNGYVTSICILGERFICFVFISLYIREFKPLHLFANRNTYYVISPSKIMKRKWLRHLYMHTWRKVHLFSYLSVHLSLHSFMFRIYDSLLPFRAAGELLQLFKYIMSLEGPIDVHINVDLCLNSRIFKGAYRVGASSAILSHPFPSLPSRAVRDRKSVV